MKSCWEAESAFIPCPHLSIAPSWECDARCIHCFLPVKVRRRDNFDAGLLRKVLLGLPASVELLSFTGGEPFVRPERFLRLVEQVHCAGVDAAVVTNGLWSRDWAVGNRVLEAAARAGLKALSLSVDDYHRPALSEDEIVRLLVECERLGIVATMKGTGRATNRRIKRILRDSRRPFSVRQKGWADLEQVGVARNLPPDHHDVGRFAQSCEVLLHPVVGPDGLVVACCSARVLDARSTPLMLGNVLREPISKVLSRYAHSMLVGSLIAFGPVGLRMKLGLLAAPGERSTCSVCVGSLLEKGFIGALGTRLSCDLGFRKEIVGRAMLVQAACGRRITTSSA
jgi:hypothetical protein